MSNRIKIGIRHLAEFCCRSGDLGYDSGPSVTGLEGIQTHQKIQQRYSGQAQAEQAVKLEITIDDYEVELGGRIDLLFDQEIPPRIEEIKTVYSFIGQDPEHEHENETHWAQLKCYAAVYALQHQIDPIGASLNYANLFNQREHRSSKKFQRAELDTFLRQILKRYLDWHKLVSNQHEITLGSARTLSFPYPAFRSQQQYFARVVYRNIQRQQHLLVEAPTGAGKTISTLFPAVKAIGEDLSDQIVYLSAKTSGQNEAIKAIEQMIGQGLQISYLVIRAKAKSCACVVDQNEVNAEGKCLRCLGFFERLPEARESLLQLRKLSSEQIRLVADEFQLCAFELSLQMLPWVDIIICDFNYVFDPLVQLSYFKTDSKRKTLLIDEMHNLVDRARGMHSASISRDQVKQAANSSNGHSLNRSINAIVTALDQYARAQTGDEAVSEDFPDAVSKAASRFIEKTGQDLFDNKNHAIETLELAKTIFRYQCISNLYGAHHRTICRTTLEQREVRLLCLNGFEFLKLTYPLFSSVCGFSATLSPAGYFMPALGLDPQAECLRLASSFPNEHLQVSIGSFIDMRYRQRDHYIARICETIYRSYQIRPGNYLVFFTSYAFMQKVQAHFTSAYPDLETRVQIRGSDDVQRADFLANFFTLENTLGFAIMGGVFAEGIDYVGHSLIGAIIVGVGLPHASTEQQLIQQDFESLQLDGFDYAYRFPGLTRVQQSAGRVIRSETDRGVIILLDRRFQQAGYRHYFPPHWQAQHCHNIDTLEQSLQQFWADSHG